MRLAERPVSRVCQCTVRQSIDGDEEVIPHVVAMHSVGCCSVIRTMWMVEDAHTSEVVSRFCQCSYMVDEAGRLDHTQQ